jgi:hypothetical protein
VTLDYSAQEAIKFDVFSDKQQHPNRTYLTTLSANVCDCLAIWIRDFLHYKLSTLIVGFGKID